MGMEYQKIHACPNDCILYRKEFETLTKCPRCGVSRFKVKDDDMDEDNMKKGPPAKVLWYLPIIPRFKRLFANVNDAKNLVWHANGRKSDGLLRHAADSPQWKKIDTLYPQFGSDPRNLRLGLATDGMNPYGNLSSKHSSWPVLLIIYNLPYWLSMKRKYMMLSMMSSRIGIRVTGWQTFKDTTCDLLIIVPSCSERYKLMLRVHNGYWAPFLCGEKAQNLRSPCLT